MIPLAEPHAYLHPETRAGAGAGALERLPPLILQLYLVFLLSWPWPSHRARPTDGAEADGESTGRFSHEELRGWHVGVSRSFDSLLDFRLAAQFALGAETYTRNHLTAEDRGRKDDIVFGQ